MSDSLRVSPNYAIIFEEEEEESYFFLQRAFFKPTMSLDLANFANSGRPDLKKACN